MCVRVCVCVCVYSRMNCVCVCLSLPLWSILEPVTLTCSVEAIRFIFHSLHCSNNGRPMARNLNNSRVRAEETSLRIMRREDEKILVTYQTINHMTQGSSVRNRKHKGGYVPFFFPFRATFVFHSSWEVTASVLSF